MSISELMDADINSGHITITVVWLQMNPSADTGLATTMWPKLVDHYNVVRANK